MWVRLDGFALGWEEAERRADDVPDGTLMESLHGRGAGFWVLARFFFVFFCSGSSCMVPLAPCNAPGALSFSLPLSSRLPWRLLRVARR